MSHNFAYVRQRYNVTAEVGGRVIANGKPGIILADRGNYIGVVLDSDLKKRICKYHPTWEIQYGDMAEKLPLIKWKVLPLAFDWDELDWNPKARGYLTEVWAATRSQVNTWPTVNCKSPAWMPVRCAISRCAGPDQGIATVASATSAGL